MAELVEFRQDRDSEFIPVYVISQGERAADDFTEMGAERRRTRVFTFSTDPGSRFCVPVEVQKHGTIIFENTSYTITDIEKKIGVVDVTTLNAGIYERTKEGWRR
jgi:hypothetical protein